MYISNVCVNVCLLATGRQTYVFGSIDKMLSTAACALKQPTHAHTHTYTNAPRGSNLWGKTRKCTAYTELIDQMNGQEIIISLNGLNEQ